MSEFGSIITLVNQFALAFSFENPDTSIQILMKLFTEDASFTDELIGNCSGKIEIENALKELAGLTFLSDTRHLASGHVIDLIDASNAKVNSSTVVYWKCSPVMVVQWTDEVIKMDGKWLFKSRKAEPVQKDLQLIGEMQLRGKKSYSHQDERA
jgi:hypothetical protein